MKDMKIYAFADEAGKSLDAQICALKRNGLDGLEIRSVGDKNIADLTTCQVKRIAKALQENGLNVYSIGSPIGKIAITDDFEPHFAKFKKVLKYADILGAKCIRIFSFFMPMDETDFTPYKDEVIRRLKAFLDEAEKFGVTLCHENEKGIYGDIAERCVEIHQALPKIKAVFDPANFVQSGQDTVQAWDVLKDYVQYLHIKDSKLEGTVVPAGDGDGNLEYILEQYQGDVLTLEPHLYEFAALRTLEREGEESKVGVRSFSTADEAFDNAADTLKNILKKL